MSHFAVIDLGTNTFHLLIVKKTENLFEEVYRKRVFVNIAEEGITTLGEKCYLRGINTLLEFHEILQNFKVKALKVFGTAALRTATNGLLFINEIKTRTDITIEIIDGQREAQLISLGTKAIVDMQLGIYLIMDIGGGSVEFILIQDGTDVYTQSFPIGITALYNKFTHSEPITADEINEIGYYLDYILAPLKNQISSLKINGLVGASGSYEVLEKMLSGEINSTASSKFDIELIINEINKVLRMPYVDRLNHTSIPQQRAKLIVIAFLLMKYVVELSKFDSLIISPFALKEGAIMEMIDLD